jgi:hypothetical protein
MQRAFHCAADTKLKMRWEQPKTQDEKAVAVEQRQTASTYIAIRFESWADTAFARDPGGALHLSVSNMHDNMEWGDPAETSMFTLGELSATG